MVDRKVLATLFGFLLVGLAHCQFGQAPCLRKQCPYGSVCRIIAKTCSNSSDCKPEPECIPGMFGVSPFNPCPVDQPLLSFNLQPIYCTADQCPRNSYCSAPFGGVCCFDFKGYYVGNKIGACRFPTIGGNCKNDCMSDQDCSFMHKCCASSCGFSCRLSYVG